MGIRHTVRHSPKQRVLATLIAAAIVLATAVTAAVVFWPESHDRTLRVGLYENAPKIYTGPDGTPMGLFPDVLNDIAAQED